MQENQPAIRIRKSNAAVKTSPSRINSCHSFISNLSENHLRRINFHFNSKNQHTMATNKVSEVSTTFPTT